MEIVLHIQTPAKLPGDRITTLERLVLWPQIKLQIPGPLFATWVEKRTPFVVLSIFGFLKPNFYIYNFAVD